MASEILPEDEHVDFHCFYFARLGSMAEAIELAGIAILQNSRKFFPVASAGCFLAAPWQQLRIMMRPMFENANPCASFRQHLTADS
jgi:hypothetical protein